MSFKTIQDIINHYQKEPKPMNNVNYNPEKLAEFKEMDRVSRYEKGKVRMLVDMRFRNPHEVSVPEGFCTTCKSFTTAYNSRGECEVCDTEVTVDISEGEK